MKQLFILSLVMIAFTVSTQAQTMEELKTKKADLETQRKAKQSEADAFNSEIGSLAQQIQIMSGWQTGLNGLIGLNFGSSNNWAANANRNSSTSILNLGLNGYANNIKEKTYWRNTLTANVSWQGLDNNTKDDQAGTDFLADRNADVLIFSSLYGFRLSEDIAITALGDLNTSIFNFLAPGTFDVGIGATWTPKSIPNLVVVVHPLTYHFAFSAFDNVDSQSAVGAKLKATYTHKFPGGIVWSSNLGAFLPYSSEEFPISYFDEAGVEQSGQEGLFEYTWINSLAIADVWKGVGVGITYGIRDAKFEFPLGTQSYTAIGLTYGF
ncbi:MAG: DUF3078 domain-containing protein [Chitinophagales bacterium]